MANVLISYFSDYGGTTYDSISNELLKNGNNVLRYNINSQGTSYDRWGGDSTCVFSDIKDKILKFSPDVVLNFNNSFPSNIELPKKCKVCLIDADAPFVFWNKETLKRKQNSYYYIGLQGYSKHMYESFFGVRLNNKNYLYMPMATSTKNTHIPQDKNISFIGSNFYPLDIPKGEDFYSPIGLELYRKFKEDYFFSFEEAKKICKHCASPEWVFEKVRAYYVGQERLKYMQQLTDLGFTFYGVRWWNKIAYYDFELAQCFDKTPIICLESTEQVYNSSKISINISHPQAKSSFSWRVMDIMASNACLLMEDKPDWRDLFEKYLSKETLDAIIYKDRFDMREKAKRLLADETLRLKCVKELNNAIEKNGRWEHRFRMLEKFLNVKLIKNKTSKPIYIYIKKESINTLSSQTDKTIRSQSKLNQYFNLRKRVKLVFYLMCLVIGQIPFIDLYFKKNKRDKILQKVHKYWR